MKRFLRSTIFVGVLSSLALSWGGVTSPADGVQAGTNKPGDNIKTATCATPGGRTGHFENAQLIETGANYACITIKDCPTGACTEKPEQTRVDDSGLRTDLKSFKPGDHLVLDVSEKDGIPVLTSVGIAVRQTPLSRIVVVFGIAALLAFVLATVFGRGHPFRLAIIGADNRYSNSKFQMAVWFGVLIASYLTVMYFRIHEAGWDFLSINIPQNLILLSGLSGLTFVGAKGITTAKVNEAMAKQVVPPGAKPTDPKKAPDDSESFFKDLAQNDYGDFDFGDFQMIVVTLLAVSVYLLLVFHFVGMLELRKAPTLPDVDTTILATFGLGQGAYLAKKAAGNVGKA